MGIYPRHNEIFPSDHCSHHAVHGNVYVPNQLAGHFGFRWYHYANEAGHTAGYVEEFGYTKSIEVVLDHCSCCPGCTDSYHTVFLQQGK